MIIEVMCRIGDGPLRPGALEVTQVVAPLVSWSVNTHDGSQVSEQGDDLAVELRFPDNTVWTGEAYPVTDVEPDEPVPGSSPEHEFPMTVQLRGIGPLRENSIPLHADAVLQRLRAMSA